MSEEKKLKGCITLLNRSFVGERLKIHRKRGGAVKIYRSRRVSQRQIDFGRMMSEQYHKAKAEGRVANFQQFLIQRRKQPAPQPAPVVAAPQPAPVVAAPQPAPVVAAPAPAPQPPQPPRTAVRRKLACARAATIGDGVEVRASTLGPTAGRGLFATKRFLRGELVTEYSGELIDRKEALRLREIGGDTYVRSLDPFFLYIKGDTEPVAGQGGAAFANDGQLSGKNNTDFLRVFDTGSARNRIFLVATRDIEPNEEIFVSYGRDYWHWHSDVIRC